MEQHSLPVRLLNRRAAIIGAAQAMILLVGGCAPTRKPGYREAAEAPGVLASPVPTPTASAEAQATRAACGASLPPVIPPTPIPYPGYTQVEPSTGLHVTAPPQSIDLEAYRLKVTGKVARELSLTYDDLRCLPRVSAAVIIECPGFFVDRSNLAGASLASALALAAPLPEARQISFTGVDGRTSSATLESARDAANFLAYDWEGEALPVSHGFPVRLALPGNIGGDWVKWLDRIEIS